MYYEHFGLDEAPFKITPDTRLFYAGGNRGDTLEALVYAVTSGEGIVKVVGEVGSGKTMLSRMLELRLADTVDLVYLANPSIAPADIVFAVAVELGVDIPAGTDRIRALHMLQEALLGKHAQGRQVVCFVEEAQAMPLETLEEIRLLSNLETNRAKLLQIVLFGQPELDDKLNEPSIRQLRERIVHSFDLAPLGRLDVGAYVDFRMRAVGYRGPPVFTAGASKLVSRASQGLIRRVNILGDKALLAAFAQNAHQVTEKHVRTAIRDSEFGRLRRPPTWRRLALAALGVVVLAVLGAVLLARQLPRIEAYLGWAPGVGAPAPAGAIRAPDVGAFMPVSPPPPSAAHDAPADGVVAGSGAPPAGAIEASGATPASPAAASGAAPASPDAASATTPAPAAPPAASADAVPAGSLAQTAATPASPRAETEAEPVGSAAAAPAAPGESSPAPRAAPLLDARLRATRAWLAGANRDHFSIQLLVTSESRRASLEQFLQRWNAAGDVAQVYVYRTQIRGAIWYGVLFSEFASIQAAQAALQELPASLRQHQPYVRNIRDIDVLG